MSKLSRVKLYFEFDKTVATLKKEIKVRTIN